MLMHVLAGLFAAVSSSDTNRDVFMAQQIASGQWFPMLGPAINGMVHLGPLWFYLLAPSVWLWPNAAAVTTTMGLISASQFPLAYHVGARLGDRTEGLLFALALALPGWTLTSFGSLTHPIMVIPGLLFGTWMGLRYRELPTAWRALAVGLALALMCAAHPTLVLLGLVLLLWALWKGPRGVALCLHALWMAVPVLLSLMPMLLHGWLTGSASPERLSGYTQTDWSLPSVFAGLELIAAIVAHGPHYLLRYWLGLAPETAGAAWVAYLLLVGLGVLGLALAWISDRGVRRRIAVLAGLLLAQAMFVAAIRTLMPPWMVYAHGVFIAALLAIGWAACWRHPLARWVLSVLLTGGVATSFAILLWLSRTERFPDVDASGGTHPYLDVRSYVDREGRAFRLPRTRFLDLFALGEGLCEPTTVYGHLAQQIDYTSAVGVLQACGRADQLSFGGWPVADQAASLGMQRAAWQAAGRVPPVWIGRMGLAPAGTLLHSGPPLQAVRPERDALPRRIEGEVRAFEVSGASLPGSMIVVAHRAFRYRPFEVRGFALDGEELAPRYSDLTLAVFVLPSTPATESRPWRLQLHASPDHVDVIELPPPG